MHVPHITSHVGKKVFCKDTPRLFFRAVENSLSSAIDLDMLSHSAQLSVNPIE